MDHVTGAAAEAAQRDGALAARIFRMGLAICRARHVAAGRPYLLGRAVWTPELPLPLQDEGAETAQTTMEFARRVGLKSDENANDA